MPLAVQRHWENFIGRTVAHPDLISIEEAIRGKCVLVTGAGGSIGSALVRGVAERGALRIVLLDASEQNLHRVDGTLAAPHISFLVNVCDRAGLSEAFGRYKPQIVFHGAAFKHVPLMERNPFAAVENNSLGTFYVAQAAVAHGAEQLILISTDKAADPIGIMGASKRIAELVLLSMPACPTRMTAVRLGNVLGSEGSVFPLFLEQIAAGNPVTVTHPEASRYFTTLEETVGFLLLAATRQGRGGVLAPDLGPPLRIADLAVKLIAAVKEPSIGVGESRIVFTRLRPGDKLSETLVSSAESLIEGASGPLRPIQSPSPPWRDVERAVEELRKSIATRDLCRLRDLVCRLVPEYRPGAAFSAILGAGLQEFSPELAVKRNP